MKGIVLLLAISVLLFGTVIPGCKGAGEKAPAAKEIVETAIRDMTRLNTYQFNADSTDMVIDETRRASATVPIYLKLISLFCLVLPLARQRV